jgi:hypothetical protein
MGAQLMSNALDGNKMTHRDKFDRLMVGLYENLAAFEELSRRILRGSASGSSFLGSLFGRSIPFDRFAREAEQTAERWRTTVGGIEAELRDRIYPGLNVAERIAYDYMRDWVKAVAEAANLLADNQRRFAQAATSRQQHGMSLEETQERMGRYDTARAHYHQLERQFVAIYEALPPDLALPTGVIANEVARGDDQVEGGVEYEAGDEFENNIEDANGDEVGDFDDDQDDFDEDEWGNDEYPSAAKSVFQRGLFDDYVNSDLVHPNAEHLLDKVRPMTIVLYPPFANRYPHLFPDGGFAAWGFFMTVACAWYACAVLRHEVDSESHAATELDIREQLSAWHSAAPGAYDDLNNFAMRTVTPDARHGGSVDPLLGVAIWVVSTLTGRRMIPNEMRAVRAISDVIDGEMTGFWKEAF